MENFRNKKLNAAYVPQWDEVEGAPQIIPGTLGDTNFDPFAGSGWGDWLDMAGAGDPGGVKLAGGRGLPTSPTSPSIDALRSANLINGIGNMAGEDYVGNRAAPGRRAADRDVAARYPSDLPMKALKKLGKGE